MRASTLLLVALIAPLASAQVPGLEEDGGFFDNGWAIGITIGGAGIAGVLTALYFLGVGGLRHVDADNVLEHPLRASILQAVETRPGVHLRELSQMHDTAVTNTQWHLRKLEMAGLIRTQKISGRRLYYPTTGGVHSRQEALENAATRNPNAQAIFEHIQENAGCNQRALSDELGINPGTVRWHLRRLADAGLIKSVPDGANTRYYLRQRPPRPKRQESYDYA